MTTALARAPRMAMGSLEDPEALGRVLAASGYFQDAKDAAQAVVKVLAGAELGFGPIASMTGVYIVKGRVTLSANLLAAAIKRNRKYDFRVRTLTNEACEVIFYEDGKELGTSEFTMADAQKAGLAGGDNWRKFPRNMLFARAVSNGAKFFCPDVFSGAPVYTPDELGADIDGETGEIIDAPAVEAMPYELRGDAGTPPPSVEGGIGMPPVPPKPEPEPEPPEPEPAPEPEPTPARNAPIADSDPDETLTPEEAKALEEYLHRIETPEAMWRMALMSNGVDHLRELKRGAAHDLMVKARHRYGGDPAAR